MVMALMSNLTASFHPVWLSVLLQWLNFLDMLLCLHWNQISLLHKLQARNCFRWFSCVVIKHCEQKKLWEERAYFSL